MHITYIRRAIEALPKNANTHISLSLLQWSIPRSPIKVCIRPLLQPNLWQASSPSWHWYQLRMHPVISWEGHLTAPVLGLIRAMHSVCQMLAQTSPLTNSSSFRNLTGLPASLTCSNHLLKERILQPYAACNPSLTAFLVLLALSALACSFGINLVACAPEFMASDGDLEHLLCRKSSLSSLVSAEEISTSCTTISCYAAHPLPEMSILTSTLAIFSRVSWSTVVSLEDPSLMMRSESFPPLWVIPHPSCTSGEVFGNTARLVELVQRL